MSTTGAADELDAIFGALADSSRRTIVDRLSKGPTSVSELAEPLQMSLSAVMQHLHVLEASGLVSTEKVGRVRQCRLDPSQLTAVEGWVAARRIEWEFRLDRLQNFLDSEDESPSPPKGKTS